MGGFNHLLLRHFGDNILRLLKEGPRDKIKESDVGEDIGALTCVLGMVYGSDMGTDKD